MRPLNLPDTKLREGQKPEIRRILGLFSPYRGTLLTVLLLILLTAVAGVLTPFLVREIVDVALPQQRLGLLAWCAAGMIGVHIAGNVLTIFQSLLSTRVGQAVMHDLRVSVFAHLQRMGLPFFTATRTGEIQSRIFSDIGSMQAVVTNVLTQIVSSSAGIIMSAAAMLLMDWRLFLFSLLTTPIAAVLNRRVGKRRRAIVKRRQEKAADLSAQIQESLSVSGILLSATLGRAEPLIEEFRSESHHLASLEVESEMAGRWTTGLYSILLWVIPAFTYLIGGYFLITGAGDITIGTLVAFVSIQLTLFPQFMALLRVSAQVNASLALFTRVFEYLDLPIPITERDGAVAPTRVRGSVEFSHVGFVYDGAAKPTLHDISLTVPAGSHLALVGATGSGKTTLGYLLARLHDVDQGAITIDGIDIRDFRLEALAQTVGVVTQETYLLHASVADNLRYARPEASMEEIIEACTRARIHEHIAALPEGYDTVVGERGYRFSGGEKQRLAIARTILRNPPILLLDEATSALDTVTERALGSALRDLSAGRTTISIAHRLSTIRDADQIVVLSHGRVVERGTYSELIASGGHFAALAGKEAHAAHNAEANTAVPS